MSLEGKSSEEASNGQYIDAFTFLERMPDLPCRGMESISHLITLLCRLNNSGLPNGCLSASSAGVAKAKEQLDKLMIVSVRTQLSHRPRDWSTL